MSEIHNSSRFFANKECEYYPCHEGIDKMNCLFCYCPMYTYNDCLGNPTFKEKNGKTIKVCTGCTFPHREENYEKVIDFLKNKM